MHRVNTKKALSLTEVDPVSTIQPHMKGLTRSCYKNLLKEAAYFDRQPLAKALLSASPFLRKDASWASLVSTPSSSSTKPAQPEPRPYGLVANTLALPTEPNSLQAFVRHEFRNLENPFDINRYFGCMRRLELAKKLHTSCTEDVAPALPAVSPKLQPANVLPCSTSTNPKGKVTTSKKKVGKTAAKNATLKPGSMLLAHPVLVDDFTQATVLVTTVNPEEGVTGLTLNVPYVPLQMVLNSSSSAESTLRQRFPELWSKKIRASNLSFFNDWTVYSGGSIACAPLLVHKSPELATGIEQMNASVNNPATATSAKKGSRGSKKSKIVNPDAAYAVQLPGGWWVHALSDIMMLDPSLVQNSVEEKFNARIVMNYSGWSEEQLLEEVCQNWWVATEATSSCKALESLFKAVELPKTENPKKSELQQHLTSSTSSSSSSSTDESSAEKTTSEKEDESETSFGAPSNYMWQRAIANLGGDLKDFARLKVVEEEEGDYRRMITSTFKDDLPASTTGAASPASTDETPA